MPFDRDTKARMFIKSSRICCLCLKQCGTNIEAAHIIDEHKGGTNDEGNGIPVCLDCHQEIGAYDPKHPKGNKFTHQELRARRDRLYRLVDSGALFALSIARASHANGSGIHTQLPAEISLPIRSAEASRLLQMILDDKSDSKNYVGKLRLLSETDLACVLDELSKLSPTKPRAVETLMNVATSDLVPTADAQVVVDQAIRQVVLYGTPLAKAAMLKTIPPHMLLEATTELRESLFEDVIETIENDVFVEVNELVPSLESHLAGVPPKTCGRFVMALLRHSRSSARIGAPAAKRILKALPDSLASAAIQTIDPVRLSTLASRQEMKAFVVAYRNLASGTQIQLLDDFLSLSAESFSQKYLPDEE